METNTPMSRTVCGIPNTAISCLMLLICSWKLDVLSYKTLARNRFRVILNEGKIIMCYVSPKSPVNFLKHN